MKNPKPTDEDVADAIKRIEGTPGDTSEVPGSDWKDTSVVPWSGCGWFLSMEENGKSCSRILLGGVLGGGIGMIVGVPAGVSAFPGAEWVGSVLFGVLGAFLGVVLGPVLRFLAWFRNVDAAEPEETSVSSDEKSQTE